MATTTQDCTDGRVCIFDITNYFGNNCGAWADQTAPDTIVFGGMWHGSFSSPTDWMPGRSYDDIHEPNERQRYRDKFGIMLEYHRQGTCFAVKGDISKLLARFDADELPEPGDFAGLSILAV